MELSEDECHLIRVMNRSGHSIDIEAVRCARPLAMIVGEAPGTGTWASCPMFPWPKPSAGWRLWRYSGLEIQDYLCAYERLNVLDEPTWNHEVARRRAVLIKESARRAAMPLILLGSRVASAFEHEGEAFEWTGHYDAAPIIRVPHPSGRNPIMNSMETQERLRLVMRQALEMARYPAFIIMGAQSVAACGVRVEAHSRHPHHADLRVLCPDDDEDGEVVKPWGGHEIWRVQETVEQIAGAANELAEAGGAT